MAYASASRGTTPTSTKTKKQTTTPTYSGGGIYGPATAGSTATRISQQPTTIGGDNGGPGRYDGPATVSNPTTAKAVRNPIYGPDGTIIGSGSTPGKKDLPVQATNRGKGRGKNIGRQIARRNRRDPRQSMSKTEEDLRKAAMRKLQGS